MKKLSAITFASLSVVFALALANAEDTSTMSQPPSTEPRQDVSQGSDQYRSSDQSQSMNEDLSQNQARSSQAARFKTMRTCTDRMGVTYRRGQKGFESCLQEMQEQMGGQAESMDSNTATDNLSR
jgi:hypothetical protein